jgi:hypothetical protein
VRRRLHSSRLSRHSRRDVCSGWLSGA